MTRTILLALVGVLVLLGCGKKNEGVTIGVNVPLTGNVSYYGDNVKKGITVAVDELNKRSEFDQTTFNIIYEDNRGEAHHAEAAMKKLSGVDKVSVVIGGGTSTETLAASPIANQTKTVLISPISSASILSNAGPYIFRTCPSDRAQAEDLADWVIQEGYRNVAVFYVSSTWGSGFKDEFVEFFKRNNGNVLMVIPTEPGMTSFRAELSQLKGLKLQAIVAIVYALEGGDLVRQSGELGIKLPIFGADPWSQRDFITRAGATFAEGIRFTTPAQDDGTGYQKFKAAFMTKYNHEPDVSSSHAYDCMLLLADAYAKGARTGEEFQNILSKTSNFPGATGTTTFDSNGDVIGKKFGRFIIKRGEQLQVN